MIKTYSELIKLKTFNERFEYLKLDGTVGRITFGSRRYLNQLLYRSTEWRQLRHKVIVRDEGRDLACEGYDIFGYTIIHHINPISIEDLQNNDPRIFDMENVILTSLSTHNAIHYGDEDLLPGVVTERTKGDTLLW